MDRPEGRKVPDRKNLWRWVGWFALANAVVLALIGIRYFSGFTPGGTALSWLYLVLVYPAHHVMLAVAPLFVVAAPLIWFRAGRRWVTLAGIILFALMIAVIMLDSLLWSQSRFHINALTLQILGWQSWVFVAVILLIGLFFQSMLARWVWQWVEAKNRRKGKLIAACSIAAILGSQFIHAWADANYYVPVTSVGTQLPVYKGFTAKRQLTRLGLVDPETSREKEIARRLARDLDEGSGQVLDYPLEPLRCNAPGPMNVLILMPDAMRSDMLAPEISPFLWRYAAEQAQSFTEHYSGGNSSRMGVFSLFYGLPPGYWSSFEALHRSAALIDELQLQDYQLGLFTSSTMYRPVSLDRTAFANVPGLRLQTEPAGAPAWERDRIMTDDWFSWLDGRDPDRPFFGFLLFDASNAQQYPPDMPGLEALAPQGTGELAERFSNYRKSIRFVDGLLESVIGDLEARGLAENTVVVITSDHGEEFDESGMGLRDHGSGYTKYQLQVPMVIGWPGKPPRAYGHRSSHYDLVPTLMQGVLGCTNPSETYSSGRNLFEATDWQWLLAGSYYNYAVLEPDQLTITFPNGRFEVRDWNYRIVSKPEIRGSVLESVARENSRFYRR